jgi:hypothetical protein
MRRSTMRKLVIALAVGALGAGIAVPPAAADQSCQAEIVSTSVRDPELGPGRRAVATEFFGDDPHAVQIAERTVKEFCAG